MEVSFGTLCHGPALTPVLLFSGAFPELSGAGEVQRSVESLVRVRCVSVILNFVPSPKLKTFFCGKKLTGTDEVSFHGLFKQYKMLLMLSFFHVIWESMSDYVN